MRLLFLLRLQRNSWPKLRACRRLPPDLAGVHLRRLELAGERLDGNVSPELVLDGLALGWGR